MRYHFEELLLDTDRRELVRASVAVPVGPQVFDLLVCLVQNRDRVVTKDDLLQAVWQGRIVSESTLTSHVNAARKAIGDTGAEQRLIRTITRKGLRFVGEVREMDASLPPLAAPSDPIREEAHRSSSLTDKPSIAVLAFQNLSGDPAQEYFVDGIVEDIITALSRMRWLFVIARNSTFTYKGRAVDLKQVGRELGVRYVLEGSVRKIANRVRITGQLIDAATGTHVWAERFDSTLDDIFELQDQMTVSIVGALAPHLERAEIGRAKRKPLESLEAYDYYLRGLASAHDWSKAGVGEALRLVDKSVALDPSFAPAYGLGAWCYYWRRMNGWTTNQEHEVAEVIRLAGTLGELGNDDAAALSYCGLALGHVASKAEAGVVLADQALSLNPNLAAAWYASGALRLLYGDLHQAIEHLERAMRISPLDPLTFFTLSYTAIAHFFADRHGEAQQYAERACREQPHFATSLRIAAASHAATGRLEEARAYVAQALELDPDMRISNLKSRIAQLPADRFAKFAEALRKAGVPE